ncbi:MAG TPA: hypothetical protein VI299_12605 [Polyangiales bacterium]
MIDFPGYTETNDQQQRTSCWQRKALQEGVPVAYPQGTGLPLSFSAGDYCCDTGVFPPRDDVQFAKDVAAKVKGMLHAGASTWKVYASGLSNGGALAHNLACEATQEFQGIAAVSQTFAKKPGHVCLDGNESRMPIIDFRAIGDTVIPYHGGPSGPTLWTESWLSAAESRQAWSATLGCRSTQPTSVVYKNRIATVYTGPTSGPDMEQYTHCERMDCNTPFVQCSIVSGHVLYNNATAAGIDVCDAAWKFFGEKSAVWNGPLLP